MNSKCMHRKCNKTMFLFIMSVDATVNAYLKPTLYASGVLKSSKSGLSSPEVLS